jgi:hypothetical protein
MNGWEYNIYMDLKNMTGGCGLDYTGSGHGPVVSSCEHGDELSAFIKRWKFIK